MERFGLLVTPAWLAQRSHHAALVLLDVRDETSYGEGHIAGAVHRNHALCRVETNPEPFKMQTFAMGEVVVEAHQFYMFMVATSIEQ